MSIAVGALLAVLGVVVGFGSPASALPLSVPVAFDFGMLPVGQTASGSSVLDIPFDSQVTQVELVTGGSPGVTWTARLCSPTRACHTLVDGQAGWNVFAGAYTIEVSATATAVSPEPSTITGHLVFFEENEVLSAGDDTGSGGGALAATGPSFVAALAGLSVAAVLLGWVLAFVARRRERTGAPPC